MHTEYAERPNAVKIDTSNGTAYVRLRENIAEIQTDEETHYSADEYTLATYDTPNLQQRVENNFAAWLSKAKETPTPIITPQDETDALMIDHELRLVSLELGI
jgi:hypothetical protein